MKNENKPLIRSKVKIGLSLFVGFLVFSSAFAQKVSSIDNGFEKNDSELIDKYIKSLGDKTIVFDGSNIKQFWVDKTVVSKNNEIIILLTNKNKRCILNTVHLKEDFYYEKTIVDSFSFNSRSNIRNNRDQ